MTTQTIDSYTLTNTTPIETSSLLRGLRILDVTRAAGGTTVAQLMQATGLPSSTTYRLVHQLAGAGYLRVVDEIITPSQKLSEANTDLGHFQLVARPWLARLSHGSNLTTVLTVRVHTTARCLDICRAHASHRLAYRPGQDHALYAGASALPLLAHAPQRIIDEVLRGPFKKFTAATQSSSRVAAELVEIRRVGYATSDGTVSPNMHAIGIPVLKGNTCVGALSLVGEARQFPSITESLNLLRRTAENLAAAA
ncbi:MAG: helix-turn-helix domain-containing protein [Propionibacteriaceae bacterium]|nr:helix-turn-helix domain-containing protein [Propionibacteriaceae bacterium]